MTKDFTIGKHTVRLVTTSVDYGSAMFRPGLRLYLTGPNGSPAGIGPKGWPLHNRIRRLRKRHSWTNAIYLPLPHLKWHRGYRLRRVGGLRLYNAQYRALTRALGR